MLNDEPTLETMFVIAGGHRKYGTTSLLPTLITDTMPVRDRAIEAAIEAVKADRGLLACIWKARIWRQRAKARIWRN